MAYGVSLKYMYRCSLLLPQFSVSERKLQYHVILCLSVCLRFFATYCQFVMLSKASTIEYVVYTLTHSLLEIFLSNIVGTFATL